MRRAARPLQAELRDHIKIEALLVGDARVDDGAREDVAQTASLALALALTAGHWASLTAEAGVRLLLNHHEDQLGAHEAGLIEPAAHKSSTVRQSK